MASSVSQGTATLQVFQLPAIVGVGQVSTRDSVAAQPSRCFCTGPNTCNKFRTTSLQRVEALGRDDCSLPRSHQHTKRKFGRRQKVVLQASRDDFDFGAGPIDDVRPTFTREAYKVPPPDPPKTYDDNPPKRKGRPQVTPAQAIVGSVIAAGCSVFLFNFVRDAYFYVAAHPPVHGAPFQLEGDINALICTMVAGFGGFAVILFGGNSVGLALLAFKGLTKPASDSVDDK